MSNWVEEGYDAATKNSGSLHGTQVAHQYVDNVNKAIDVFQKDINSFVGYNTGSDQLQGDIAEYWHGDTFNINAAINESKLKAFVNRDHDWAGPDIEIKKNGDVIQRIGLKYYKNAPASANAQDKSYIQRFCEYQHTSGRSDLTLEQYLTENNINDNILATDPIYSGQVRLIPSDQYEAAISYLKWKIQKESMTRPEEVKRCRETLALLTSKIHTADGTGSKELPRETSQELANLAKKGKFDPADFGVSTEELMNFNHALAQGVKAGTTAAIITLVLKTAPQLYKCLEKLISEGKINEDDFQKLGFQALTGAGEGFVKGFVAGTIVTACESGIWGASMQSVNPSIVGALTAIMIQSMQDSFLMAQGSLTQQEFTANLSKNLFVASCGIGLGTAVAMLTACPFAYMLGNFVGSMVGSFAYVAIDDAFMSFAVYSGWTFFGVVKQDYKLPEHILKEIGIDIFEYEEMFIEKFQPDEFSFDEFQFDEYQPNFISIIRRGVIGVHQVGYIED